MVMRPKSALLRVAVGLLRFTRFSTLNPSARNSILCPSDHGIRKFLKMEASNVARPGPYVVFRPSVPNVPRRYPGRRRNQPLRRSFHPAAIVRQAWVANDVDAILTDAAIRIVDTCQDRKRCTALQSHDPVRSASHPVSTVKRNWRAPEARS